MQPYVLSDSDKRELKRLNISEAVAEQALATGATPNDDALTTWDHYTKFFLFKLQIWRSGKHRFSLVERGNKNLEFVEFTNAQDALSYFTDRIANFKTTNSMKLNIMFFYVYDMIFKTVVLPLIVWKRKEIFSDKNDRQKNIFSIFYKVYRKPFMDPSLFNQYKPFIHTIAGIISLAFLSHLVF